LRALDEEGYTTPTPIQAKAIPPILEGRDLLGCAQTGTGKTAAFALPMLQLLAATPSPAGGKRVIRALVLSPTRELATQIADSFKAYGRHLPFTTTVVFGGVGQNPQVQALTKGIDILVATPGRLLDLMGQGFVKLDALQFFVLDEADRMLDMGFIHDVKRIIKALPAKRQSLFFSATLPRDIQDLSKSILTEPVRVEVTPVSSTAERIEQSVYFVDRGNKRALLSHVLKAEKINRALVFTRTKHIANRLVDHLEKDGIRAEAIHGNKSQSARERALANFRAGTTPVLVATDIAARGIDVDGVSHVVNFELPNIPESYVHRIGRTARAGAEGIAISFCDSEERAFLKDIEKIIRMPVPVVAEHPYKPGTPSTQAADPPRPPLNAGRPGQHRSSRSGNGHGNGQGKPAGAAANHSEAPRRRRRRSGSGPAGTTPAGAAARSY